MMHYKDMENMFQEGTSFVDLLALIEFQKDVCVLCDGSLGRVWAIPMQSSETHSNEIWESRIKQWHDWLVQLPQKSVACQFIVHKHNGYPAIGSEVSSTVDEINRQKPGSRVRLDVYVTLRYFPKWQKRDAQSLQAEFNTHLEEFLNHSRRMEALFDAMGQKHRVVDEQGLIDMVYRLTNPRRSTEVDAPLHNDALPIRDQVLFNCPKASGYGFEFEGYRMKVISLKNLPGQTIPGMLTKEFFNGPPFCLLDQASSMLLALNITIPDQEGSMSRLKFEKDMAFMHQHNWLGDKSVESTRQKMEIDEVIEEIFQSQQRVVGVRMHVVVQGKDHSDVQEQADRVMNGLHRLNCEGIVEEIIGASLFMTCLPLGFDPYFEKFIRRSRRMLSLNAADLVPVFGAYQGTTTSAQTYVNRRGERVCFDFFDSNTNPHGIILGASGAGKSFFVNDFILQASRLKSCFYILDKGDSYKKLCRLLNGHYVSFELNNPVLINPFAYALTPQNLSFLMSLLSLMASGGDERSRLTREEEGLLQKAVVAMYGQCGSSAQPCLSDLVVILNDNQFNHEHGINSLMGPTLALRLAPFTRKGPYGGFFDGKNTFVPHDHCNVFELANLSSYPDLQAAVLLNVMHYLTNAVASEHMRPLRKYLLIDEAWSLLKFKNTADFITSAFKTFRKYRCCTIAITQEVMDLTQAACGMAIIANASNKIFLKQEHAIIDAMKDHLSLSNEGAGVLKTLQTIKGQYSEALVVTDAQSGVIRLIPDPFLYWVANSEPKNNQYLNECCRDLGNDFKAALCACAKEHPYGV